jgi:formate dehydrogenase iron-sulfur subunit
MKNISRRDFLKVIGTSAALLGVGAKIAPPVLGTNGKAVPISPRAGNGILIDTSKCVGCKQCQLACMKSHNLPADDQATRLSPYAPSVVEFRNVSASLSNPQIQPIKRQCMNCIEPSCVSACTVGALQKRADGPVVYDDKRCIGCRYCMYACPFGVPTFEWNKQFSLIRKCDGCADRIDQGKIPACAEACPAGALTYGNRSELLTVAKGRIAGSNSKYVNHVYGESEAGGTSMLYLATIPFEKLGLPSLPDQSPAVINETITHSTPAVATGMVVALSSIYWIMKRLHAGHVQSENANTPDGGK